MNAKQIIEAHLREKGFDGLRNSYGECVCHLDDLFPCDGEYIGECEAGHEHPTPDGDSDFAIFPGKHGPNCGWQKPEPKE